jgi:hypothetical protein
MGEHERIDKLEKDVLLMGNDFKHAIADLNAVSKNLKAISDKLDTQSDHTRRILRLEKRMETMNLFYVMASYPKITLVFCAGLYALAASGMWRDIFKFLGGL